MNLFFVRADGSIVTPELNDSILEGVTRDSVLTLLDELGHKVEERRVDVDEWRDGVASGEVTEVFACGTAAVVTPVGMLRWRGGEVDSAAAHGGDAGPVTTGGAAGRWSTSSTDARPTTEAGCTGSPEPPLTLCR